MLRFVFFCLTFLFRCHGNATVIHFSVPEEHHVCLQCGGPDGSRVVWTHGDRRVWDVPVAGADEERYLLLSDGGLCLLQLDDSDNGEYRCNRRLVAELQVLTGQDFLVTAGRTLLLPCSRASKPRQRWFHRRRGGRREAIFTRFRNGTAKAEREDGGGRLGFANGALQIRDLRPEDAGEYHCNGELRGKVTVLTERPEPTAARTPSVSPASSAAPHTDVVEIRKKHKKRSERAVLMVAAAGLGLMLVLLVAVCVLLSSVRCRRKRRGGRDGGQRRGDTELQPWTKTSSGPAEREALDADLSLSEETIHYASLGRQTWRDRPGRTPPDQDRHRVIYSSVVTRPAAK